MTIDRPKIYADYNKTDGHRLVLTCLGTKRDLESQGLVLERGLELTFYMDSDVDADGNIVNLLVDGTVDFDEEKLFWVATIDESTYRNESTNVPWK